MSEQVVLKAKNLKKTFCYPEKITVINNVDLEIKKGELIAITGKSGAGKSTLLYLLGKLEKPTSGFVEVMGKDGYSPKIRNQHMGFIFQQYNLIEELTLFENIALPAQIARRKYTKKEIEKLLDEVGLLPRAHFPAKLLSGGEKQRATLARAMINNPEILLADEPTGNLDKNNSNLIHDMLIHSAKTHHKSLIIVTHDQNLANMCDKQYLLEGGELRCE